MKVPEPNSNPDARAAQLPAQVAETLRHQFAILALSDIARDSSNPKMASAQTALIGLPLCPSILWHDRQPGSPWPEIAPWSASDPWSEIALRFESAANNNLAAACEIVMIEELKRGNNVPLAQWMKKGWALGPAASEALAGLILSSSTPIVAQGRGPREKIDVASRNWKMSDRVKAIMAEGAGLYEFAVAQVAKEFRVGKETVRKAYEANKG